MRKEIFLFKGILAACVVAVLFFVPAMSEIKTQGAEQKTEGAEKKTVEVEKKGEANPCEACHADRVAEFKRNPHAVLDTKGLAKKAGAEFSCASCHTGSEAHLKNPGKGTNFAFKPTDLVKTKTEVCETCHRDTHPQFPTSPHAKAGMDCTSCHNIHAGNPARALLTVKTTSETCRSCHAEVFAKFNLNERHRLQEGILECTSCHDPHKPQSRMNLGGFKQAECLKCHTDKQGPYVYEHGSVEVEGCVACHEPHGSVNRHQLKLPKVAMLCYSCHPAVPHTNYTSVDANCSECHTYIHGSNLDPTFRN